MGAIEESSAGGPIRQRIGDAERDRATECLREHMASGRLDADEFDDRVERALTAHFQSELDVLFRDLPAPHPQPTGYRATAPEPAATPAAAPANRSAPVWNVIVALMWVGAAAVCWTVGWHLWWLMFIPMVMSGGACGHQRQRRLGQHRHQRMRRLGGSY